MGTPKVCNGTMFNTSTSAIIGTGGTTLSTTCPITSAIVPSIKAYTDGHSS